jgi:hypothetical protein
MHLNEHDMFGQSIVCLRSYSSQNENRYDRLMSHITVNTCTYYRELSVVISYHTIATRPAKSSEPAISYFSIFVVPSFPYHHEQQ